MSEMKARSERDPVTKRRALAIGLPAAVAIGAAVSVPFLLGSGGGTITTTDATTTTIAAATVDTGADTGTGDVFTSAEGTTGTATPTSTTTTTTTTTTIIATTTTTAVVETLPEQPPAPIAPPADPRAPEDQILLGGISIPKLGVDAPLLEGIRLTTLDNGPGHWPGTAMPGEVGNVVVAAHRTSHGAPFRNIDQLVAGDSVVFTTEAGQVEYVVTGTEIVEPNALWIVDQTDTPTATLFACHPPGSVSQRIVAYLELAA